MTVVDLPPAAPDGGRSADVSSGTTVTASPDVAALAGAAAPPQDQRLLVSIFGPRIADKQPAPVPGTTGHRDARVHDPEDLPGAIHRKLFTIMLTAGGPPTT